MARYDRYYVRGRLITTSNDGWTASVDVAEFLVEAPSEVDAIARARGILFHPDTVISVSVAPEKEAMR